MNHCSRIHLKDFCIGIIKIPIWLIAYTIISAMMIITGTILMTILTIIGEPTNRYKRVDMIALKDKRLRFKKGEVK